MDVIIVTSANTDDEGRELLRLLGMPFRRSSAADAAAAATASAAKA
jgi:large subunit ribosomal protein L5